MQIADKSYVSIEYTLKLDSGEVIDQSEPGNPLGFIYGAGMILPGLEKQLAGKEAGAELELVVEPDDGYGPYDEEMMRAIDRKDFPEGTELEVGQQMAAETDHGFLEFTIVSIEKDEVLADFNHPLAKERLTLQ